MPPPQKKNYSELLIYKTWRVSDMTICFLINSGHHMLIAITNNGSESWITNFVFARC